MKFRFSTRIMRFIPPGSQQRVQKIGRRDTGVETRSRNQFEPNGVSLIVYYTGHPVGAAMNKRDTEECLKRAKECARQADAAIDPELKIYLMKLALSWTQAAGEAVERELRTPAGWSAVTKSASRPLPQ